VTKIIKIKNRLKIDKALVEEISRSLLEEQALVLPASTIYGLSCKFDSRPAFEKIYQIKRRKRDLPFIILISNTRSLKGLVDDISKAADALISRYWNTPSPMPLTIIFKKKKGLDDYITGGRPTIAVRVAGLELIRKVIDISGPIVSTSATISGTKDSPVEIKDIPGSIKDEAGLIVDWGQPLPGIPSTIVDASGSRPKLIREGSLRLENNL